MSKTSLIIGASAGVGRALAKGLANRGHDLLLVARDKLDLEAIAQDCRIRYGVQVWILPADLADPQFSAVSIHELVDFTTSSLQNVFLAAGAFSSEDVGVPSSEVLHDLFQTNFWSLTRILEMVTLNSSKWGLKNIVVCSNIVARLPRNREIAYSAAKAALEIYTSGLRHALFDQGILVQTYVLGHIDSAFNFVQRQRFRKALPTEVAREMIRNLDKDVGLRYLPSFWRWIVQTLRLLPWSIYRRLSFTSI